MTQPDHPGVAALRDDLRANNGSPDLELVDPIDVVRATELFHRDGFVVRDALTGPDLEALREATDRVVDEILNADPLGEAAEGRAAFHTAPHSEEPRARGTDCMPEDIWLTLSDHAKRVCRYIVAAPGEVVLGARLTNPRAAVREAFLEQQADEVGAHAAARWWLFR